MAVTLVEKTGLAVVILAGVYRLTNRWAGEFLKVQRQQAEAMGTLAGNVNQSIENGRDTQTVLRAISVQIDGMRADVSEVKQVVLRSNGG